MLISFINIFYLSFQIILLTIVPVSLRNSILSRIFDFLQFLKLFFLLIECMVQIRNGILWKLQHFGKTLISEAMFGVLIFKELIDIDIDKCGFSLTHIIITTGNVDPAVIVNLINIHIRIIFSVFCIFLPFIIEETIF